jgi:hypothetical protein
MFQNNKKTITFDTEAAAAQYEQYQKLLQSGEDLNEQFSLMDANITSATNALQKFSQAEIGAFKFENIEKLSNELDKYSAQRSILLGITKADADSIKESLAASYGTLAQYGVSFGQIVKAQNTFISEFNTNSQFTEDQLQKLLLTEKATGVESKKLVHNFREAGMGIDEMNKTMQTTMDYARSIGVASSAVLQKVTENISKLNLYNFSEGEKGLAKMAAQSAVLGIDMSKTFQLSENLLDPQKAIDLSASLQRLGVASSQLLDPLRAMDLAQNDPAELQNQMVELSKQFVKLKDDQSGFEILPGSKRQLREVAQALGMNADELASMGIKASETSRKLQEIRFSETFKTTDEEKQLIANLAKKEGNEYVVDIKREEKDDQGNIIKTLTERKNITELDQEDLKLLSEQSQPIKLEDLSQKQLTQLESINNKINAEANVKLIAGATSGTISQLYTGVEKALDNTMKEYQKEVGSNKEQIQNLLKELDKFKNTESAKKIESGDFNAGNILTYTTELTKVLTKLVGEDVINKLKFVTEKTGISTPGTDAAFDNLKEGAGANVIGGLVLALTNLTPEIKSLVGGLKKLFKIDDAIIQGESSIISLGSGEVVIPDKKDKIAVGTNLDGMNNTTNLEETLTRRTPTVSEIPTGGTNISVDLIPLTTLMSEYVKNNKPQTINLSGLEQLKPTQTPVSEQMMAELKKIVSDNSQNKEMSSLELLKDMSSVRGNQNNDDLTRLSNQENSKNLYLNTPKTVRETTVPTFNPPQIATMERPMSVPSQKVEFGKLEISLKVDIPNSANVNPDQIKQVLETTMNSTDFKQKLVGAVNDASSNFGQTSVGGTSNYGANKTNYSLNA